MQRGWESDGNRGRDDRREREGRDELRESGERVDGRMEREMEGWKMHEGRGKVRVVYILSRCFIFSTTSV